VATEEGSRTIADLEAGDEVLAWNEATGETGSYEVVAVWEHADPVMVHLTIDGEVIETTLEHPFYTDEAGWVPAGDLWDGARVRNADGSFGAVEGATVIADPEVMYNLTVEEAHTFFVGDGKWLVHNTCRVYPPDFSTSRTHNWTSWANSEQDARQLAREKLGSNPVEVAPNKWRSQDGKWQYRAKPGDVEQKHIHLEEINPLTGEVLQNLHIRWK
jgi:hypothetical protein